MDQAEVRKVLAEVPKGVGSRWVRDSGIVAVVVVAETERGIVAIVVGIVERLDEAIGGEVADERLDERVDGGLLDGKDEEVDGKIDGVADGKVGARDSRLGKVQVVRS